MANGTPFFCVPHISYCLSKCFFLSGKLGIFAVTRSINLFKKE